MNHRNTTFGAALLVAIACSLPLFAATGSLPAGTQLQIRMIEKISSETAKPGDTFHGTLAQAVVVNGRTMFDKGSDVTGQVIGASGSGRLRSPGELQLAITSIRSGWFQSTPVNVQPLWIRGGSHTKANAGKIGGGAAAGAILGAIAGGGKGAAIGAGVGAGTGTLVAAATGKREAIVESEALLVWTTVGTQPLPASAGDRPAYGNSYRDEPDDRDREGHGYGYAKQRKHHDQDEDEDQDGDRRSDRGGYDRFSDHDRDVLRACLSANSRSDLPPGLAKRDRLPPGLEKQLQRNGTLPPGLEKRVEPLPERCEVRLPRLPRDWERVILSGRIILLGEQQQILDMFLLRDDD